MQYEGKSSYFDDECRNVLRSNKKDTNGEKTYVYTADVFEASDFEYVEFERLYGKATVYLNDVEIGNNLKGFSKNNRPYRFYCSFNEGRNTIKIVTSLSDGTEGPIAGYAKLGRRINAPWEIDLYGGIARIFVKSEETPVINASKKIK
jgi:hypothetical protein